MKGICFSASTPAASVPAGSVPAVPAPTGPDYLVEPIPVEAEDVELESVPVLAWKADDILVSVKAQNALPRIFTKKDYSVWLHLDVAVHALEGEVMKLAPCELFGFNLDAFKEGCLGELVGHNQEHQPDHILLALTLMWIHAYCWRNSVQMVI